MKKTCYKSCTRLHENILQEMEEFGFGNLIELYFNFAYFLCLSPYRVAFASTVDQKSLGKYISKSWWPQKMLCGIFQLLILFWVFEEIRLAPGSYPNFKNPSVYFDGAAAVIGGLVKVFTVTSFWFHFQQDTIDILNYLLSVMKTGALPVKSRTVSILRSKTLIRGICLAEFILCLFVASAGKGLIVTEANGNQTSDENYFGIFISRLRKSTRRTFFLAENSQEDFSSHEVLLVIFGAVGYLQKWLLNGYDLVLMFLMILILWLHVSDFVAELQESLYSKPSNVMFVTTKKDLNKDGHISWHKFKQHYLSLHQLAAMTNKSIGTRMTVYLMELVVYFSTNIDEIFREASLAMHSQQVTWNVLRIGSVTIYFLKACIMLYFSASVSHKMGIFKVWLRKEMMSGNKMGIPMEQVTVIISDLECNALGIMASQMFTITPSLIAAVSVPILFTDY